MLLFLALLCQWLTLGSQAKCKPTLWVLDVWATMRPTCTSFLSCLFFLFYDTGFPEPPWSGNHRFWHQSSGATVFYSGWGRSCEGHFYPGSACMEPLPHQEKCACLSRCVEKLWDSENASSLFCCRDEEIRSKCGIDAVTYLSFQRHIILLMTVVTLLSLAVILPVNISGNLLGILVLKWWSS